MLKKKTRDPLESKIRLSLPGQSAFYHITEGIVFGLGFWYFLLVFLLILFMISCVYWYFDVVPNPLVFLVIIVIVAPVAVWRGMVLLRKIRSYRRGYLGEVYVGQTLQELVAHGYAIFHDIDGGAGGNIDHAVVGPGGIFAIETKTRGKPLDQKAVIEYDGQELMINGTNASQWLGRHPIDQSKTAARIFHDQILNCSGKKFYVQPVLLFPGWWVKEQKEMQDVWVLTPERFVQRLRTINQKMTEDQVGLVIHNLRRTLKRPNT